MVTSSTGSCFRDWKMMEYIGRHVEAHTVGDKEDSCIRIVGSIIE